MNARAAMLAGALLALRPGAPAAADACDLARGEAVYQKCAVCHPVDAGAAHAAGPNLHGVVGRAVGKVEDFRFSKRMRKAEVAWSVEHLDAFLDNPAEVYPRTRMAFAGLKDAADRAAVICYLEALAAGE